MKARIFHEAMQKTFDEENRNANGVPKNLL